MVLSNGGGGYTNQLLSMLIQAAVAEVTVRVRVRVRVKIVRETLNTEPLHPNPKVGGY